MLGKYLLHDVGNVLFLKDAARRAVAQKRHRRLDGEEVFCKTAVGGQRLDGGNQAAAGDLPNLAVDEDVDLRVQPEQAVERDEGVCRETGYFVSKVLGEGLTAFEGLRQEPVIIGFTVADLEREEAVILRKGAGKVGQHVLQRGKRQIGKRRRELFQRSSQTVDAVFNGRSEVHDFLSTKSFSVIGCLNIKNVVDTQTFIDYK